MKEVPFERGFSSKLQKRSLTQKSETHFLPLNGVADILPTPSLSLSFLSPYMQPEVN